MLKQTSENAKTLQKFIFDVAFWATKKPREGGLFQNAHTEILIYKFFDLDHFVLQS